jgi:hypothetical protein
MEHQYKCEICNYETNVKCNYNKHIESGRHIKRINNLEDTKKERPDEIIKKQQIRLIKNSKLINDLREKLAEANNNKEFFEKEMERLNLVVIKYQTEYFISK